MDVSPLSFEWYTADLHLSHVNIGRYCGRPWSTVAAHDRALVSRWNAVVGDQDRVLVVGDLAMGRIDESLEIATALRGRKFLVPGNHDRCHPMYSDYQRWTEMYEAAGFKVLQPTVPVVVHLWEPDTEEPLSISVNACHYPHQGESRTNEPDRDGEWRPEPDSSPLLHGHVHDHWLQRERCINVGVDVWNYFPVSEIALAEMVWRGPLADEPNRVGRVRALPEGEA